MRLLFVFIDGVGLGEHKDSNPFVYTDTPGLSKLLGGNNLVSSTVNYQDSKVSVLGLDAKLGIIGLPQSATGQTTIFTGENAAAFLGRHLRGFPNLSLRNLIAEKTLFKQLKNKGYRVAFANAYRPKFFELLSRGLPGCRYSCSTLATFYGGLSFYNLYDIIARKALYMDITNERLQHLNVKVPILTPDEGAVQLLNINRNFDFCLFEYFLSDITGHRADYKEASCIVKVLDSFISGLAERIKPNEEMLIVTSDHGNIEDVTGQNHTLNLVPLLMVGAPGLREHLAKKLNSLCDLLPAVKEVLAAPAVQKSSEKEDSV